MLSLIHIETKAGTETFSPEQFGSSLAGVAHAQLENNLALLKDLSIYEELNKKIISSVIVMLSFDTAISLAYFFRYKNPFPRHWYIPIRNGACEFFLSLQAPGTTRKIIPEQARVHFENEIDRFTSVIAQVIDGSAEANAIGDCVIDGICHHSKLTLDPVDTPRKMVLNTILSSRLSSTFGQFDEEFLSIGCDISKHDIAYHGEQS